MSFVDGEIKLAKRDEQSKDAKHIQTIGFNVTMGMV